MLSEASIPDGVPPARRPELDFALVTLRESAHGWSAGTRGVIVDAFEEKAMVEIADKRGRTLDLLTLPYSAMIIFKHPEQEHSPAAV